MTINNIVWDVDGEDLQSILPTSVVFHFMPKDGIADILSCAYGFCVISYEVEGC